MRSKPAAAQATRAHGSAVVERIHRALSASLERASARNRSICAALSGGVDSVVMLHGLASIARHEGIALTALHVNHGLSPSAYRWERHCRTLCRHLRVPLTVRRVKVPTRRKEGLESAARTARYAALANARAEFVALAHQVDDQAETVLMNLLRGAGLRGAAAMPEVGDLPTINESSSRQSPPRALRPLLSVPREAIVAYAIAHRLHWVEDESNADEALSRNWMRGSVAPILAARYPRWRENLARAAAHFGDADAMLSDRAGERLYVAQLRKAPKAQARLLLRDFLLSGGTRAPDTRRLDEMLRQVLGTGPKIGIAHDGKLLRVYRAELALQSPAEFEGEVVFHATKGAGIDAAKFRAQPVTIRARQGGERLRLAANRPSRTLKNLFQEAGIPPWERDRAPLVYSGEELVWVPGLGIAAGYRAAQARAGLIPEWVRSPREASERPPKG
jgi:tRNA(Ile)-lysidine synthase